MRTLRFTTILLILSNLLAMCKKEDFQPELVARTGPDTQASIGDTVWLDASGSTGSDYTIKWSFHNQPGDDTIARSTSDSAYFIPLYNGTYQVKLTLTKGSLFSSDYQNVEVSGAVKLDDLISSNTRLKKISVGEDADYIAMGEITVTAELIVEQGVVIEFRNDASLVVREEGQIYAEYASFIPADSTWKGICLQTTGNTFANCLIDNAGNASFTTDPDEKAALAVIGTATVAFSGNTVSNSGGYGLIVLDGAGFFFDSENQVYAFRNNHFVKNVMGPMMIPVQVLSDLSGQYFEEETVGTYIEIYASSYAASAGTNPWISDQGMAYRVTGLLEFNRDLTINNGVEMYFEPAGGIRVNGKLTVSGTSQAPVIMDGISGAPSSWTGIHVRSGQADLSYLELLNAGNAAFSGQDQKASLIVEQILSMKNSTISGSGGIGLYMPGNAHIQYNENFTGNVFADNAVSAIRIRMDDVEKVADGNTIQSPASIPAVEIHMGLDDPLGTWADLDADYDYRALESLTIKSTKNLILAAGVRLKMSAGTILQVSGGLQAIGTSGSEIIIEGSESKKGHWDGIFLSGSQEVRMDYVRIRDGGGDLVDKANLIVEATAGNVSITNSVINNSKGYGVLVKSGASNFGINDPASNNTLEGDLGDFHQESK